MQPDHKITALAGYPETDVPIGSGGEIVWEPTSGGNDTDGSGNAAFYKGRRFLNREEIIKHFGWENGIPAGYKIVDPLEAVLPEVPC